MLYMSNSLSSMSNLVLSLLLFFWVAEIYGDPITCNETPYPEACNEFIKTKYASLDLAFDVTMDKAIQAHQLVSAMDHSSFDDRAVLAWNDCLELYEDTIDKINRSMRVNDSSDQMTWLSASIANVQTCQNGFSDIDMSFILQSFTSTLTNFSQLLSNSLAITKASQQDGRQRRLLSDKFPEWVPASDREHLGQLSSGNEVIKQADLVVSKDGAGNYRTITEAVVESEKLRKGKTERFIIYVKSGIYKENIEISKNMKNIMIIGDGIESTIVTGTRNFVDGSTTFRSATFGVSGDGFIAQSITFENTAGPEKHQAVALRSGADHSVFYRCSFKGYQDTLYVYSQRQFYRDCDIYGTIDFICGDAAAVLQNCNIYIRKPLSYQKNSVTAQARTDPNEKTGIIIHKSRIMAAPDLRQVPGSYKSYLGRPWQKYSRTVIMKSVIDGVIDPIGWDTWIGNFGLNTLYYGEYMNSGSGANTDKRVNWSGHHVITSITEASKFTVGNFLAGESWIPITGVPFEGGL